MARDEKERERERDWTTGTDRVGQGRTGHA